MRTKLIALLVLALGCGLVASIGITQVMAKRGEDAAGDAEMVEILVAKTEIGIGDTLNAEMVVIDEWPRDKVPDGALSAIDEIDGRRAKTVIFPDEAILDNKLFGKDASPGADMLIPQGLRVIAVKVQNETGGADMLLPGSRVDVMVNIELRSVVDASRTTVTETFLQDVKVFAVNDTYRFDGAEKDDPRGIKAKTVSLLVTPEQAEMVASAADVGKIRLVMRGPDDKERIDTGGFAGHDLIRRKTIEAGDREKEDLMLTGQAKGAEKPQPEKDKMADFLAMLEKVKAGDGANLANSADAQPNNTGTSGNATGGHKMRILQGPSVMDVTLRTDGTQVEKSEYCEKPIDNDAPERSANPPNKTEQERTEKQELKDADCDEVVGSDN